MRERTVPVPCTRNVLVLRAVQVGVERTIGQVETVWLLANEGNAVSREVDLQLINSSRFGRSCIPSPAFSTSTSSDLLHNPDHVEPIMAQ